MSPNYPGCVTVSHTQIGDVALTAAALMAVTPTVVQLHEVVISAALSPAVTLSVAQLGSVAMTAVCLDGDEIGIFFFDDSTPIEFDSGVFVEVG